MYHSCTVLLPPPFPPMTKKAHPFIISTTRRASLESTGSILTPVRLITSRMRGSSSVIAIRGARRLVYASGTRHIRIPIFIINRFLPHSRRFRRIASPEIRRRLMGWQRIRFLRSGEFRVAVLGLALPELPAGTPSRVAVVGGGTERLLSFVVAD